MEFDIINELDIDINGIYLDEDCDEYINEGLTKLPMDGEVWETEFPFGSGDGSKKRKTIYLKDSTFGIIGIRVSTLKLWSPSSKSNKKSVIINGTRYADPEIYGYNKIIYSYRTQGFTKPVYFVANNAYQLKHLTPLHRTGKLLPSTHKLVKEVFETFKRERYKAIFNAIDWLLLMSVDCIDTFDTKMQSINDLEKTMKANSIDITNVFHIIASWWKINHRIVSAKLDEHNQWFVVFKHHDKWRYVHFVPGKLEGYVSKDMYSSYTDAANGYAKVLQSHFNTKIAAAIKILSPDEVTIWDKYAMNKSNQLEMLKALESSSLNKQIQEMFMMDMI